MLLNNIRLTLLQPGWVFNISDQGGGGSTPNQFSVIRVLCIDIREIPEPAPFLFRHGAQIGVFGFFP